MKLRPDESVRREIDLNFRGGFLLPRGSDRDPRIVARPRGAIAKGYLA
ncbi:MAG: hypothetical protein IH995_04665 [Proteobacteria bacterium]|nr:hypothetical protein [Pseudomonadota bacterium]